MNRPRVLLGVPTYEGKNYCYPDFARSISQIITDGFDVTKIVVDNTDDGRNIEYLKQFGVFDDYISVNTKGKHVNQKLADSHNIIREATLQGQYDYMLHIESDVFCPEDILWKLYHHKKRIVSGWYMLHTGANRWPIHCNWVENGPFHFQLNQGHAWKYTMSPYHVQKVGLVGVGACLMKASTLRAIEFRFDPENPVAPDTNFSKDAKDRNITWWVDNSVHCYHANDLGWGTALDFLTDKFNQ